MPTAVRPRALRSLWLLVALAALLLSSCSSGNEEEKQFTVGTASGTAFDGKSLVLRDFRPFNDGFFISRNLPPDEQLKGRVLFQVRGIKRATNVATELGKAQALAGAPGDSATAKAARERYFPLKATEYDLTEYSAEGQPTDVFTEDIDKIVVE